MSTLNKPVLYTLSAIIVTAILLVTSGLLYDSRSDFQRQSDTFQELVNDCLQDVENGKRDAWSCDGIIRSWERYILNHME